MDEPKPNAIGPIFDDDDGLPSQQRATGGGDEDLKPLAETPKNPARRAARRERNDDDPRASRRAEKRSDGDPRQEQIEHTGDLITPMSFDILPQPPKIDGWHLCWLSTTNVQDSIQNRERMGYKMVNADEIGDDFSNDSVKDGKFAGGVQIREMVLYKVPQDAYEAYMMHMHHNEPILAEQSIKQDIGALEDQLSQHGSNVMVGQAIREMGRRPVKPSFDS